MNAALIATGSERNTDISRRNDSRTTPPMNRGSRLAVCSLSSMNAAVVPPTEASTPVPATAAGDDVVAQRVHEVLGGLVLRTGRGHDRDHGGVAGVVDHRRQHGGHAVGGAAGRRRAVDGRRWRLGAAASARSTATRNGPLAPGPKPSLIRS